jgi:hypothetical protein
VVDVLAFDVNAPRLQFLNEILTAHPCHERILPICL